MLAAELLASTPVLVVAALLLVSPGLEEVEVLPDVALAPPAPPWSPPELWKMSSTAVEQPAKEIQAAIAKSVEAKDERGMETSVATLAPPARGDGQASVRCAAARPRLEC
jgi:hypothetical protein